MQTMETNDYVMLGLFNTFIMPYGFQALLFINEMTITITCTSDGSIHFKEISGLIHSCHEIECLGIHLTMSIPIWYQLRISKSNSRPFSDYMTL